jgi:hypothetical protein
VPRSAWLAITGRDHATPSGERLTAMFESATPTPRVTTSHVRCDASYATAGSLARSTGPGGC